MLALSGGRELVKSGENGILNFFRRQGAGAHGNNGNGRAGAGTLMGLRRENGELRRRLRRRDRVIPPYGKRTGAGG